MSEAGSDGDAHEPTRPAGGARQRPEPTGPVNRAGDRVYDEDEAFVAAAARRILERVEW